MPRCSFQVLQYALCLTEKEREGERARARGLCLAPRCQQTEPSFLFSFLPVSLPELMMNYERAPAFPENTDVSTLATSSRLALKGSLACGAEPYRAGDSADGKKQEFYRAS